MSEYPEDWDFDRINRAEYRRRGKKQKLREKYEEKKISLEKYVWELECDFIDMLDEDEYKIIDDFNLMKEKERIAKQVRKEEKEKEFLIAIVVITFLALLIIYIYAKNTGY